MNGKSIYSGKFLLRVGNELHARLRKEAQGLHISLNELVLRKINREPGESRYADLGIDRAFIERMIAVFPEHPIAVVLFGSWSRGDATVDSDIDLLVVFEPGTLVTRALYRPFDEHVDVSGFSHVPNPHLVALPEDVSSCGSLWLEAALDGDVIWETDRRVASFLRAVRLAIAEGRARRKTVNGLAYWVEEGAAS